MKKLIILSMAFFFSISLVFGQNEEKIKEKIKAEKQIKKDIKETKDELRIKENELKIVKQERRKLEGSDVSNRSKDNFLTDFGIKDVQWKRSDFYDVATYTKDGNVTKAFYDFDSQLIGTTRYAAFTDIPANAQEKINEKYKDYKIGDVIFYDDNEPVDVDFFLYESQFKHEDNYFVEMTKGTKHIVLKVSMSGDVSFFKELK